MKKIKKITKKQIKEGISIVIKYGYWGQEVRDFQDKFEDYNKIASILASLFASPFPKHSIHYSLLEEYCKENNIKDYLQ